jgi:DNA-binding transcriptional ArsR family regulator
MISKHLGVLKRVGLVSERRRGRQRLYRINADQIKPIHDWVSSVVGTEILHFAYLQDRSALTKYFPSDRITRITR